VVFRTIATSAALLIGLAVVGAVAGPQWNPVPVADHLQPATSSTAIGGVDPALGVEMGQVGDYEVRETVVTVPLDGTQVEGLLRQPIDETGEVLPDRAGIVFVHGAGTGRFVQAFTDIADALASAGVVTLVPDKRLDTYSTRDRDYVAMAADYQRSVDLLRAVDGVYPERVGVYGESEGTWIAPVMQAVDNYLRNTGGPEQVFRAIPRAVGMQVPGGGFDYVDFDVRPWLERQTAPVFAAYGAADPSMPIEQGARQIIADTAVRGDDAPVTVRYYEGANHGIKQRVETATGHGLRLHPDFARDVATWVQGQPGTADAPPRIAGDTPNQLFLAVPVPQPRWWGNGDIVLGAVLVGAGLIVLGPILWSMDALVRSAARRRSPGPSPRLGPGLRRALLVLALGAIATTVALVTYLLAVARLALDYERDDLVVQGGWVGVRLLGVVTVVAGAVVLRRVVDATAARRAALAAGVDDDAHARRAAPDAVPSPEPTVARGWPAHLTFWSVVVGSVILLVTLSYWGVYQLGI
jgi:dienelactone hydrolase